MMGIEEFLDRNSFRDNYELILKIPTYEEKMQECLTKSWGKYKAFSNNCTTPVQACFKDIGLDLGDQLLPENLGKKLLGLGMVERVIPFPSQQSRPVWKSAPWAW